MFLPLVLLNDTQQVTYATQTVKDKESHHNTVMCHVMTTINDSVIA